MKKCSKGKSCGGTCISKGVKCRVELKPKVSQSVEDIGQMFLRQVEQGKQGAKKEPSYAVRGLIRALKLGTLTQEEIGDDFPVLKREAERQLAELRAKPSMSDEDIQLARDLERELMNAWEKHTTADRMVLYDRQDAREFDYTFNPTNKIGKDFDWEDSYGSGSKALGAGSYGYVMVSKPPPPVVVKRGEVSTNEALILEKLTGKDIAPKLYSAEMDMNKVTSREGDIQFFTGRIAMSRLSGTAVEEYSDYKSPVGNTTVGDSYYALRKRLHESGIAHNDAHVENVLIDDKGKARFLDFGLSQDDPRAALSEAIGVLADRRLIPQGAVLNRPLDDRSGDRQARKFDQTYIPVRKLFSEEANSNLGKIVRNRTKVYEELRKLGLSNDEIAALVTTELRQPLNSYNKGPWAKVSREDAMRIIPILYKGVS